jgi:hypothetical protein
MKKYTIKVRKDFLRFEQIVVMAKDKKIAKSIAQSIANSRK